MRVDEFDHGAVLVADHPQRIGQCACWRSRKRRVGPDLEQGGPRRPRHAEVGVDVEHRIGTEERYHLDAVVEALGGKETVEDLLRLRGPVRDVDDVREGQLAVVVLRRRDAAANEPTGCNRRRYTERPPRQ